MKNRIRLSGSTYRMLATDILPYERPPFFSNRMFARLMKYYEVRTEGNILIAGRHGDDKGIAEVLKLLSGGGDKPRKSFKYAITKDGVEKGRDLTVIHPFHQMKMMEFYRDYETLIIYYCSRSDFSLRHPVKVAKEVKGKIEYAKVISDDAEVNLTQEHARNYFVYERISNISQFYDHYLDLRLEKQFNYEAKIDIEKCFDSIDPNLLPNLIMGGDTDSMHSDDFASRFAQLHVKFHGEPKGIVIGPEFSRVFAEIFIQQVERRMMKRLVDAGLRYPKDFRMLRYVDDTFVYANSIKNINKIVDLYSEELKKVGLSIKKKKAKLYRSKPFIDEISVVKERLRRMIEKTFENRLSNFKGFMNVQKGFYDEPVAIDFRRFITAMRNQVASVRLSDREAFSKVNTKKEENIASEEENNKWPGWSTENEVGLYKDISSYLISVIRNNFRKLLKDFNDLYRTYSQEMKYQTLSKAGEDIKARYEKGFIDFCIELVEVLFFIYSSDPRMPISINVVELLDELQAFVRGKYRFSNNTKSVKFPAFHIARVDEKITDETHQVLRHREVMNGAGLMETLTLLELQRLMFPRNRVSEEVLLHFLNRVERAEAKDRASENDEDAGKSGVFNFLTIFQLIHFTEGKRDFAKVRKFALDKTKPLIERFKETNGADTESLLTVVELISLPSVDNSLVEDLHEWNNGMDWNGLKLFFNNRRDLFVSWKEYSLAEEIRFLKNAEVY